MITLSDWHAKKIASGILESSFETGWKSEWHTWTSVDQVYIYIYIIIVEMLKLFLKQPLSAQAAVVPWGIPSLLVRVFQVMGLRPCFCFEKKQMFHETKSQNDSSTWIVFGLYTYLFISKKWTSETQNVNESFFWNPCHFWGSWCWKTLWDLKDQRVKGHVCLRFNLSNVKLHSSASQRVQLWKVCRSLCPLLQAQPRWRVCGWHSLLRHQEQAAGIEIHRLSLWKL